MRIGLTHQAALRRRRRYILAKLLRGQLPCRPLMLFVGHGSTRMNTD